MITQNPAPMKAFASLGPVSSTLVQNSDSELPDREQRARGLESEEDTMGLLDDVLKTIQTSGVPEDPRAKRAPEGDDHSQH